MNTPQKVTLILTLTLAPVTAVIIYGVIVRSQKSAMTTSSGEYQEIDWRLLLELDVKTGDRTQALSAIDGKPVKLPGFVVPLYDYAQNSPEFLLVPSPQACIHAPPPPANQMVIVRMQGKPPQRSWGPVWVKGRIFLSTQDSQYGQISYMMSGESSEPYRTMEEGGG